MKEPLAQLRALESQGAIEQALPTPASYATRLGEPAAWSEELLEQRLRVSVPADLREFWKAAGDARVYEDESYGQWGLVLWSPAQAVERNLRELRSRDQYRPGDLIVGEFLGDSDLVLIRADEEAPDFGAVIVADAIYPRSEWSPVGRSLAEFLTRYLEAGGRKYWEGTPEA